MFCAISGEAPQEPVVSKKSGALYEKRLIEQYVEQNGTEPGSGDALTKDDLLPLKTSRIVRPRPPTLTSIPALLATLQNEWDAIAQGTRTLQEELARTREELTTALYQVDAAERVIVRLMKERDDARDALSKVTVSGHAAGAANGDDMAIDTVQELSEELAAKVDETQQSLSKGRKKRPVPDGWITPDEVAELATESTLSLPFGQTSALAMHRDGTFAAIPSLEGTAAVFSVDAGKVERQLDISEPVTDALWTGSNLIFSTTKGAVKVFENGQLKAALSEHSGAATALALHPSRDMFASVGADKSIVLYDLSTLKPAARAYTGAVLTKCAFHPDGHLFAAGTSTGDIKLFTTKTLEEAAVFSLGAPIQALAFSENGFWFAATAKGQTTVTIFDLRKEGDASKAKVLEVGGAVLSLCWDYTAQFLATAGTSGITVQRYAKSAKKWSEPLRTSMPCSHIAWGADARKLLATHEGSIAVLGVKE